jgi:ATP-dependent DNA helicase RecQ
VSQRISEAKEALERVFGFPGFRPGQQEILEAIFAGENVLAVMPTGAGKSLCYQLPAVVRRGLTVVVSPLVALMRDQVQQLQARGIAAAALNSSNNGEENAAIEAGLRKRRYRLLYVAPERLARRDTPALLREAGANVLAVDEAHCVSQWGHDFRPEYLEIAKAAEVIGKPQLIAVTATADAPTREDIVKKLFPGGPQIFVGSFDRPNLYLAMRRALDPVSYAAAIAKRHRGSSGIIYCATRKDTVKLSEHLSTLGVPALPYHAGLDAAVRCAHEDEFLREEGVVIAATVAFGMGIDKPNVRFVCHAGLPQSIEAYYQEIGRAGRDGLPAETLTLFSDADILLRERQINDSDAPPARKRMQRRKLHSLIALCESPRCRRQALLAFFGEASEPCGNCDICQGKWPFFNGATAAQKVMSAIHRTSGRFSPGHLANILIGRVTGAVKRHGHDLLPTFGAGTEFTPAEWRSIFYQLQAAGLITQDPHDSDRFVITAAGRDVLIGASPLSLRGEVSLPDGRKADARQCLDAIGAAKSNDPPLPREPRWTPAQETKAPALTARQSRLLAALKAKRLEVARRERLPPFVIFHDSTLIEMALRRPETRTDLLHIPGVGQAKAARYGPVFLEVIAIHGGES